MIDINPSKEEFFRLAGSFNIVPVYGELLTDCETPVSAFFKLRGRKGKPAFLLESVEGGEKWGRYSFLGFDPIAEFSAWENRVVVRVGSEIVEENVTDPLVSLKKFMEGYRYSLPGGVPRLSCGAVGYIGYDYVRFVEKIPTIAEKTHEYPDLFFMIPSLVVVFDNLRKKTVVIANVHVRDGEDLDVLYEDAASKIESVESLMFGEGGYVPPLTKMRDDELHLSPMISEEDMRDAIEKTRGYIRDGEAIQVVLSNRFSMPYEGDPFNSYRALRIINPSPYMFYFETDSVSVAGSSPEVLVRLEGENVILRPIAGTRPRGGDEEEDRLLESDLLSDPKELAEHLMLVDLGRNDLGRISRPGSVKVSEFMVIERYSHVMHIVSNVVSKVKKDCDAFDVVRATFPAGTVTGAPKVRAMEIIEEFEPERRGIYAGAVGYFDFSGNMDLCIAIRTLVFSKDLAIAQAGAGIVYDSVPEREIKEIENKARALTEALRWGEKK